MAWGPGRLRSRLCCISATRFLLLPRQSLQSPEAPLPARSCSPSPLEQWPKGQPDARRRPQEVSGLRARGVSPGRDAGLGHGCSRGGAAGPCSPGWTTWPQGTLCQLSPAAGERPQHLLPWPGDRAHPGQGAQQGTLSPTKSPSRAPRGGLRGDLRASRVVARLPHDHSRALGLAFPTLRPTAWLHSCPSSRLCPL